jgi:hypothetical protein
LSGKAFPREGMETFRGTAFATVLKQCLETLFPERDGNQKSVLTPAWLGARLERLFPRKGIKTQIYAEIGMGLSW